MSSDEIDIFKLQAPPNGDTQTETQNWILRKFVSADALGGGSNKTKFKYLARNHCKTLVFVREIIFWVFLHILFKGSLLYAGEEYRAHYGIQLNDLLIINEDEYWRAHACVMTMTGFQGL